MKTVISDMFDIQDRLFQDFKCQGYRFKYYGTDGKTPAKLQFFVCISVNENVQRLQHKK